MTWCSRCNDERNRCNGPSQVKLDDGEFADSVIGSEIRAERFGADDGGSSSSGERVAHTRSDALSGFDGLSDACSDVVSDAMRDAHDPVTAVTAVTAVTDVIDVTSVIGVAAVTAARCPLEVILDCRRVVHCRNRRNRRNCFWIADESVPANAPPPHVPASDKLDVPTCR